jgi:hypothetical protein
MIAMRINPLLPLLMLMSAVMADVSDPVLDASKLLLEAQRAADADFDYWTPNIYLFRFELDVTGDGHAELFVGSSSMVDRSPVVWSVYSKNATDETIRLAENLMLYPGGFFFDKNDGVSHLRTVYSGPSEVLIRDYLFSLDGTVRQETREYQGEDARKLMNGENWRDALNLGERIADLQVQKVLLAEYLENPKIEWRQYDNARAPESQGLNPTEAPFLEQVENFSPEQANELIQKLSGETPLSETTSPAIAQSGSKLGTSTAPSTAPEATQPSAPGLPIIFIAILAAIIVGAAVFFLRRKSP